MHKATQKNLKALSNLFSLKIDKLILPGTKLTFLKHSYSTSDHPLKRYMESEQFRVLFLIKQTSDTRNSNGMVESSREDEETQRSYNDINKSNEITSLLREVTKSFYKVVDMFFITYKQLDSESYKEQSNSNHKQLNNYENSKRVHQCVKLQMEGLFYSSIWAALKDLFK